MHSIVGALLVVAAFAITTAPARAAEPDIVAKGLTLAREQCAVCHLLGKEKGLSSLPTAPPFADIANSRGITAAALRVILNTPHESMPNLVVRGEVADSIIAYILSLKHGP